MDRKGILDFVSNSPVCHMATVENGQPRVRAMQTAVVDDSGLTFCTGAHKDICKQLLANPSVELSYWNPEEGKQIRIRGKMEHLEDLEAKKAIVENVFTFLKPVVERHGYAALSLFRLSHGELRVWSNTQGHQAPEVSAF